MNKKKMKMKMKIEKYNTSGSTCVKWFGIVFHFSAQNFSHFCFASSITTQKQMRTKNDFESRDFKWFGRCRSCDVRNLLEPCLIVSIALNFLSSVYICHMHVCIVAAVAQPLMLIFGNRSIFRKFVSHLLVFSHCIFFFGYVRFVIQQNGLGLVLFAVPLSYFASMR